MTRKLLVALLLAMAAPAVAIAQEAQSDQGQRQAQETPAQGKPAQDQPEAGTEPLPDIDVWDESEEDKDDVFVPSESISADSSIAFPSDI